MISKWQVRTFCLGLTLYSCQSWLACAVFGESAGKEVQKTAEPAQTETPGNYIIKNSVRTISKQINELENRDQLQSTKAISEMNSWANMKSQQSEYSKDDIDRIKEYARRRSDQIGLYNKERTIQLENSALALYKSYINSKGTGNINLSPLGTNVYVRNYQFVGEPSGGPTPLLATPQKLIPNLKPPRKKTN